MVVVIEHQETEDLNANPSNNPVAGNDASDGFETASDTDLRSDTEGDDIANSREEQDHPDQQQPKKARPEQDPEQSVSPSNGSSGDPLINEELEQKLLVQANEVKTEGNKFFVDGKYEEALSQYEHALQVAPEVPSSVEIRSICHVNRAVCFQKLGKYDNSVKECTKALELNPVYIKALVRRGEAHESLNILKRPLLILEIDPSNDQARKAIRRLERLAADKREKMKEEMMAKLKEMGNSVLGHFGMSVDNFNAVQDPNTGSYSISFQR